MRREWIEMFFAGQNKCFPQLSPSMRREWIEMLKVEYETPKLCGLPPCGGSGLKSHLLSVIPWRSAVSLHAEGVD